MLRVFAGGIDSFFNSSGKEDDAADFGLCGTPLGCEREM